MTGFSITIFIGGLVTGWGGSYVDIYRDLVSRGSCDALPIRTFTCYNTLMQTLMSYSTLYNFYKSSHIEQKITTHPLMEVSIQTRKDDVKTVYLIRKIQ